MVQTVIRDVMVVGGHFKQFSDGSFTDDCYHQTTLCQMALIIIFSSEHVIAGLCTGKAPD